MEAKRKKERSTLGWVMTFAGTHRGLYAVSVAVAAVGCADQALPMPAGAAVRAAAAPPAAAGAW